MGGRTTSPATTGTGYTGTTADEASYRSTGADMAATGIAATGFATTGSTASAKDTTPATTSDKDTIEVPLTEEELKVGKRTVSAGQVRLRKIVRTEIVNQPVEIRHEDVVVERIPASEVRSGTANSDFEEQTIDVPLSREEAVVSKEAHVTGAVRVSKTAMTETQNVSDSVRKEDVEVLRDGKTITEERGTQK